MTSVAAEMNQFATGLAEIATSAAAIEFIEGIFDTVAGVIDRLEQPALNLAEALLDVGNAVNAAFGPQLASGLASMVDNFAAFLSAAAESGQAVAWVEGALQVFSQLGDVVGSLVGIFQSIGQAATASGENMLGAFAGVLATLDEVLASSAGQDFLAGFFDTLNALGDAVPGDWCASRSARRARTDHLRVAADAWTGPVHGHFCARRRAGEPGSGL